MPTPAHYCVIEDVNALVPQSAFSATSRPSQQDVEQLIEMIALRIDATIKNIGYVVPVASGAISLALLKDACAKGAVGEAQMRRLTGVTVATDDRGRPLKNYWTTEFEAFLARLCDAQDPFELPDAERTDQQILKNDAALVQSSGLDDTDTFVDNPVITRNQTL
jgi:hypothetical protein